jgi:diguanylate cyclase (GGDEF)-like protein
MLEAIRQEDTVARLGGDEFVIVLQELNIADGVAKPVEKIIHAVSLPYTIHGHCIAITASAGVSIYPVHGDKAEALLMSADLALYEAKRCGKNDYRIGVLQGSNSDMT